MGRDPRWRRGARVGRGGIRDGEGRHEFVGKGYATAKGGAGWKGEGYATGERVPDGEAGGGFVGEGSATAKGGAAASGSGI